MTDTAQTRAVKDYRKRLSDRGLARFEVLGREDDRGLIRALARRLADDGPDAALVRETITQAITEAPQQTGGILAALRRSPLVGANLDLSRSRTHDRPVDL